MQNEPSGSETASSQNSQAGQEVAQQPISPQTPPAPSVLVPPIPQGPGDSKIKFPKWIFVLLGLLGLLAVLGAGYFLLEGERRSRSAELEESLRPIDLPNRYTSAKCGYSVTYPEGWYVNADTEEEIGGVLLVSSSVVADEIAQEGELRALFTCSDYDPSLDAQAVTETLNQRYGSEAKVGLSEEVIVSGKPAFRQTVEVVGKNRILEYYIFPAPGKAVIINFVPADTLLQAQIEEILGSLVLN